MYIKKKQLVQMLKKVQSGEIVTEVILVLPVFMMAVFTLISFIGIYSVQTRKLTETCQNAKRLGLYAALEENLTDTLTIPNIYRFSLPYSILPFKTIYMENHVSVRCWIGERESGETTEEDKVVYITENGNVFHRKDCTYLQASIQTELYSNVSQLRNNNGERYSACRKCAGQGTGGVIYITSNGNRYHSSISCSSLSHVIIMVKYSEAIKDKRPCSKCGGGCE